MKKAEMHRGRGLLALSVAGLAVLLLPALPAMADDPTGGRREQATAGKTKPSLTVEQDREVRDPRPLPDPGRDSADLEHDDHGRSEHDDHHVPPADNASRGDDVLKKDPPSSIDTRITINQGRRPNADHASSWHDHGRANGAIRRKLLDISRFLTPEDHNAGKRHRDAGNVPIEKGGMDRAGRPRNAIAATSIPTNAISPERGKDPVTGAASGQRLQSAQTWRGQIMAQNQSPKPGNLSLSGASLIRPASGTGSVGGSPRTAANVISGNAVRLIRQ